MIWVISASVMGAGVPGSQEVMSLVRKKSSRIWSVIIGVVLLVGTAGYVHEKYFFNPLTFRNNDVLYLPWQWYTKPMYMQIAELSLSTKKPAEIKSSSQIRDVISELEKGSTIKAIPFDEFKNIPNDKTYVIFVRNSSNGNVQIAYLFPKEKIAEIGTVRKDALYGTVGEDEFISLTPDLLHYVEKQFGQ